MKFSADTRVAKNQKNWLKYNGFSENGKVYCFVGDTFQIKDDLKALGAKFNNELGWHIDHKVDEYPCLEVDIDEIASWIPGGYNYLTKSVIYPRYGFSYDVKDYIRAEADRENVVIKAKVENPGNYVGSVGAKIHETVKFVQRTGFNSCYGYTYVYQFETLNGDVLVWMTSSDVDIDEEAETVVIDGTVKAHKEYKGKKQTTLTRVKVVK